MEKKLFDVEIEEIKGLQSQLANLNDDLKTKSAKVEQLTDELAVMKKRRDEIENIIKQASSMLMDGSLSDDDYCAHKKELAELYQSIDNKDSLLAIYEKAVDIDYIKKHAEINNKLQRKKTILITKYAQKVAFDVVSECEPQLKQLLAIFPAVDPMRLEELGGLPLGNALIHALNHELDGSKKPRPDPNENKQIYQNVLNELGV